MRLVPLMTAVVSTAALLAVGGAGTAAAAPQAPVHVITAKGKLTTYKPELVPAGARAHVFGLTSKAFGTSTALLVTGLLPNREYGAHAHTKPCGATGDLAGPHYQNVEDPVKPSVDPAYANPRNEIWLDLTTDATGRGVAVSKVDWTFTDRRANSIVIHETHTHTDPGHAGTAGARLACVTVGF
ncbi:superoxide dismutase family protein [Amycolatopsis regifaucium]|uniref:Superoxide dismutase n=1 Tax=Amycolatopsis regifaucium TaxID=546365 RepID=A0A154MLQ1_9PSEU|nr:superoxide dismutase family protein [Amycolatopsis regifaucium]KZB85205.1 superoxide dismutase [Amycolatopsis regifaucium]OKA03818.1 superoxide dismutase [Amycolatopsis regifaucium]SFH90406.1 superoxide dismutase, Cu-Zn family [Amycolatopsis regifaucium]